MDWTRRRVLPVCFGLGAAAFGGTAVGQPRRGAADAALRVGTDIALADSGLAAALQQAFGRDTGIAAKLVAAPALAVLAALEHGELDAALSNAPHTETRLERDGLAHDRRAVATGRFVLVGPAPAGRPTAASRNAVQALVDLRDAAQAGPGGPRFVSAADGSGTHLAEDALWRRAAIAPAAPWHVAAAAAPPGLIAQARAHGAWALVELGAWQRQGGAPLVMRAGDDDPLLEEPVHVLRAFRSRHPAAALFVAWVAGPKGRQVVAAQRGYRVG